MTRRVAAVLIALVAARKAEVSSGPSNLGFRLVKSAE